MAAIAAQELSPAARARIANLLGGDAASMMVLDANWADEVRDDRPETGSWHFVDIEIGDAGYDAVRDCAGGNCVVAQIEKDVRVLSDPATSRDTKAEALKFLIHFVGDIHQPLHTADRHDRGGNALIVNMPGRRRFNLHRLWDTEIVSALGNYPVKVAVDIDSRLSPSQKAALVGGAPEDWANESFALATKIYATMPDHGVDVPVDYPARQAPVVRRQLARAGLRLAAMLNKLFR